LSYFFLNDAARKKNGCGIKKTNQTDAKQKTGKKNDQL
jgi:hypothetical protein